MKTIRTVTLFVLATVTASALAYIQVDAAEQTHQKNLERAQIIKTCEIKGRKFKEGVIVIDRVHRGKLIRQQCNNGRWIEFKPSGHTGSFQARPGGPSKYSCGDGGCNGSGDDDRAKLVESGKCHGNPISCDPKKPSACHCDCMTCW